MDAEWKEATGGRLHSLVKLAFLQFAMGMGLPFHLDMNELEFQVKQARLCPLYVLSKLGNKKVKNEKSQQ